MTQPKNHVCTPMLMSTEKRAPNPWLVRFVRSHYFIFLMLLMSLYSQMPHPQAVFAQIAPHPEDPATLRQAFTYAITMEFAIALFVLSGWYALSYLFAGISIATNVAYYHLGGTNMFSLATRNLWVYYLFSCILPVAIAAFTHLLAKSLEQEQPEFAWLQIRLHDFAFVTCGKFVKDLRDKFHKWQNKELLAMPDLQVVPPVQIPVEDVPQIADKYLPILQALQRGPLLASHIAKETSIPQSSLFRQGAGLLVDLMRLGKIKSFAEAGKTFYVMGGE